MDFFTIATATFSRPVCLGGAGSSARRVVHFNVTEHPTAEWTGQQMVESFPKIPRLVTY
jgi:putative transposase